MAIELIRTREPSPDANAELIAMLRDLLVQAEAAEIQAAAVAYASADGEAFVCYEADGYEAQVASAARQIDDELRAVLFYDGE